MPNAQVLEAKKATVSALAEQMKGATAGVFVDYKGITVEQDTKLRNEFREAGVNYTVVKNTLTRLAARDCGYDFDELLNGTAEVLAEAIGPIGKVYRTGGDEFYIFAADYSETRLNRFMDRMKEQQEEFNRNNTCDYQLDFSFGAYLTGLYISRTSPRSLPFRRSSESELPS